MRDAKYDMKRNPFDITDKGIVIYPDRYPVSVIAEELGRSKTSIRNHLLDKTEVGRLALEVYDMMRKSGANCLQKHFCQVDVKTLGRELNSSKKLYQIERKR